MIDLLFAYSQISEVFRNPAHSSASGLARSITLSSELQIFVQRVPDCFPFTLRTDSMPHGTKPFFDVGIQSS